MFNFGIYNPFLFVKELSQVDTNIVYKLPSFYFVFSGASSVTLTPYQDSPAATLSTATKTWTIDTIDYEAILASVAGVGGTYYLQVDGNYCEGLVEITPQCETISILSGSSCANGYYNFDGAKIICLFNAVFLEPIYESITTKVVTQKGEVEKVTGTSSRERFEFVNGLGYVNLLEGLKRNDLNTIDGIAIKNIRYSYEQIDNGNYARFTLSYELDKDLDITECCEDLNIDEINSGVPSVDCGTFAVSVAYSSGTITATPVDMPVGTLIYRWYKNGIFLANGASITTSEFGNYSVEARVNNCIATATYFIQDACSLFTLEVTALEADISATVSNAPSTTTYTVTFEGTIVSTSLPYTALATGNYFINAMSGSCSKIKGIYVSIEDTDFTILITENGSQLESVTDAVSPTYLWEFEDSTGITVLGTTANITRTGKGIYWLSITANGKTKKAYKYYAVIQSSGVTVIQQAIGYEFDVYGIDFSNISNPANDILLDVNGVIYAYQNTVPTAPNLWTINGGLLTFWSLSPLTNDTITIRRL